MPAPPPVATADNIEITGAMPAKIPEVVIFKLGDGSGDALFESTGDHRIEVAATHVVAFRLFIGWCSQQAASASLGAMSDEHTARVGILRDTLQMLRESMRDASTALQL